MARADEFRFRDLGEFSPEQFPYKYSGRGPQCRCQPDLFIFWKHMFGTRIPFFLIPVFLIVLVAISPLFYLIFQVLLPYKSLFWAPANGFSAPTFIETAFHNSKKLSVTAAVVLATFFLGKRYTFLLPYLVPPPVKDLLATMTSYGFMTRSNLSGASARTTKETRFALKNGGEIGGISNDGNTCFMNSVIQSLASSKELLRFIDSYLYSDIEVKDLQPVKSVVPRSDLVFTAALRKLIENVNGCYGTRGKEFSAKPLLNKMPNGPKQNFFTGYNQEDAQEFYQLVMNLVESEYKKASNIPKQVDDKGSKFVDVSSVANYVTGCDQLGKTLPVYVPATHVDPNIEDAEHKAFKMNLVTPVDGVSAERIGCLVCGEVGGIRYSVMSGISLNLPRKESYYSSVSLQELLDEWINPEIIEDVNCNRCGLEQTKQFLLEKITDATNEKVAHLFKSRLAEIDAELKQPHITDEVFEKLSIKQMIRKTKKSKQIYMSRPPALLSIHINRSVFDPRTYMVVKNSSNVEFPAVLDLSPYVVEPRDVDLDARMPFRRGDAPLEKEQSPALSEPADLNEKAELNGKAGLNSNVNPALQYQLKAVIAHYGTHNYGHYICYRKHRGTWWRVSDESVYAVTEHEALNSQGTFMLFFEYNDNETESLQELTESDLETEREDSGLNNGRSLQPSGPSFRNEGEDDDLYENDKSDTALEDDVSMDSGVTKAPSTAATEDLEYTNGEERAFHM